MTLNSYSALAAFRLCHQSFLSRSRMLGITLIAITVRWSTDWVTRSMRQEGSAAAKQWAVLQAICILLLISVAALTLWLRKLVRNSRFVSSVTASLRPDSAVPMDDSAARVSSAGALAPDDVRQRERELQSAIVEILETVHINEAIHVQMKKYLSFCIWHRGYSAGTRINALCYVGLSGWMLVFLMMVITVMHYVRLFAPVLSSNADISAEVQVVIILQVAIPPVVFYVMFQLSFLQYLMFTLPETILGMTLSLYYAPLGRQPILWFLICMVQVAITVKAFFADQQLFDAERLRIQQESQVPESFLRYMFHEIRVPLSSVSAALDTVLPDKDTKQSDKVLTVEYCESLQLARFSIQSISGILDSVLDLQSAAKGQLHMDCKSQDLSQLVDKAVQSMLPFAAQECTNVQFFKGYRGSVHQTPAEQELGGSQEGRQRAVVPSDQLESDCCASVDTGRFVQVLNNLISNAIKYGCERDVQVCVWVGSASNVHDECRCALGSAAADTQYVIIDVVDSGQGMTSTEQEQAFALMHRFARHSAIKGSGLGLSISKTLVQHMGGIIVPLHTPGGGATMSLMFPAVVESHGVDSACASKRADDEGMERIAEEAISESPRMVIDTILLCEDDKIVRKTTARMLKSKGLEVIEACNGKEGVDAYIRLVEDQSIGRTESLLVLMDYQMPVLNGADAIDQIRQYEQAHGLARVVAHGLTGHALESDVAAFMSCGLDGVMTKPIKWDSIKSLIGKGADRQALI